MLKSCLSKCQFLRQKRFHVGCVVTNQITSSIKDNLSFFIGMRYQIKRIIIVEIRQGLNTLEYNCSYSIVIHRQLRENVIDVCTLL